MDPMNNPTPTPNPEPNAGAAPEPAMPEPAAPAAEPVAPEAPAVPNPEPMNTVVTPGSNPIANNPAFQPEPVQGLAATDPIMQPERPPEPDPIEEELKAPMKAADPVPGSIGSAVSGTAVGQEGAPVMPAENPFAAANPGQTPSVPFNDPATQPDPAAAGMAPAAQPAKPAKKVDKKTLMILAVVLGVVAVVLVVILIMQLTSGGSSSSQTSTTTTTTTTVDDNDDGSADTTTDVTGNTGEPFETLSCVRNMSPTELVNNNNAASGTISISAEFDQGELATITRVDSVTHTDESGNESEPVASETYRAKAADLTDDSSAAYYLTPGADGTLDLTADTIQANYEALDFVCEVL